MKGINKIEVGLRIKQIRINGGYTYDKFGALFGASRGNIQAWEYGKVLPNKERLALICEYGNITVNELLYGFDEDVQRVYVEASKLSEKNKLKLVKKIMESIIDEWYW